MKAMQGILLLAVMLVVSCSEEPEEGGGGTSKTPEQIFVETIDTKLVWDSDGTELAAGIDDNKEGTLGDSYVFNSLVVDSTTQAIYELKYGSGFIGVELFDDNKQAVMYKKGTVEEWVSIADVSFTPEHRLLSSAKGEWIANAQDKDNPRIDGVEYTLKNDGNLYSAPVKEGGEDILTFTHVSHPEKTVRTPHDGLHRDRAIYKKSDTEFFGLLANDTDKLAIYKDDTVDYWSDEASVSFDDTHKFFSFADDISGKQVWDSTGDKLTAGFVEGTKQGALGLTVDDVYTPTYFYDIVVTDSTTQAYYTNASGKFIGVEFDSTVVPGTGVDADLLQLAMYKKGTVEVWATSGEVTFSAEHEVRSSSKGEWIANTKNLITKVNDVVYTMKDDGNLYDSTDALAFTYVANYVTPVTRTPNDGLDAYKAIYKKVNADEYLGLSSWDTKVFTVNYQPTADKAQFWATAAEVVFTDPDPADNTVVSTKVPRTEEEQFINNTYGSIVLDVKDKELTMSVDFATAKAVIKDGANNTVYTYDSYKGTDETGVSPKHQAIYKSAREYIGVEFVSPNVAMYRKGGKDANGVDIWTAAGAVEFKNETATVEGWALVGNILTANSGSSFKSCFPSITIDNNGNLYAAFRNHSAGRSVGVIKYTPDSDPLQPGTWAPLVGTLADTIGTHHTDMNDIVAADNGVVFTSYIAGNGRPKEGQIGVFKYDPANASDGWVKFGDKIDGADAEFIKSTDSTYDKSNLRKPDPNMLITIENGVEYIYIVTALDKNTIVKKRKTDGSDDWVQVGTTPFNEDSNKWASTSLVLNPKTEYPVVGISGHFQTQGFGGNNQTTRVAEFDGTDWIELGDSTEGVSGAGKGASGHSVAVNSTGDVYVAYTDVDSPHDGKYSHTVKKWTGTTWVLIGDAGFTKNKGDFVKMQFYSDGTPVVTIGGSVAVTTVVKAFYFDNTSWKSLGANQVSENEFDFYSDSVIDTREGPDKDKFYAIFVGKNTSILPLTVKSRPRVK